MNWMLFLFVTTGAFLASGCASNDESARKKEPAHTAPAKDTTQTHPKDTGTVGPAEENKAETTKEPEDTQASNGALQWEKYGFSFVPISGLTHFVDAASKGVDKKTEAFMKASGMRREKGTLDMFYRAAPFASLIVSVNNDDYKGKISDVFLKEKADSYRKTLPPFGMHFIGIERLDLSSCRGFVIEYKKASRPYLKALSAVYYGLPQGRSIVVTYTSDAYAWTPEFRQSLLKSLGNFSTLPKKKPSKD